MSIDDRVPLVHVNFEITMISGKDNIIVKTYLEKKVQLRGFYAIIFMTK